MTSQRRKDIAEALATAFPLREVTFSDEISLRPLLWADLDALTAILGGDPAMSWTRRRWTIDNVSYLLGLRLAHYESYRFGIYGVVDVDSRELVGMAGLQFWDEEHTSTDVEVIAYIRRSDWSRGLGTSLGLWCCARAFAECPQLSRIVAATRHDNVAAQTVARRMGMTTTGEGDHYGAPSIFWKVDRADFARALETHQAEDGS